MKSAFAFFAGIILLAGQALGADNQPLTSQKDKASYTIGVASGNNLKQQSIDIDPDIMAKGLKDSATGGKTLLTDQEMQEVMAALRKEIDARKLETTKEMAVKQLEAMVEKNKKEGEAFLSENAKREGVTTLPSGLQYKVISEGKGKSPKPTDTVVVHYRGTLLNGKEFDSSYKRNEPANIKMDSVIKGWQEALPRMQEGAKWQLFIPSGLAYGETGNRFIEPNSALIFEIELISVVKEAAAQAPDKPKTKAAKSATKSPKSAAGK
ncbi:MAG: FKBP-type peptidyl-prolyl cis-trans isomerase [Deltaproteobacteria bacterium]